MATPKRDKAFEARVIADSIRYDQVTAAKRNGIAEKSVYNYRKAMHQDTDLARAVQEILVTYTHEWEGDLYDTLRVTLEQLKQAQTDVQINPLLKKLNALMEIHFAKEQWAHVLKTAAISLYDAEQKPRDAKPTHN